MPSHHHMTQSDASRIQSSQAKGGGDMSSGGFAARAQSAGDRAATSTSQYSSQGSASQTSSYNPSSAGRWTSGSGSTGQASR
ncbi:hypothetical protein P170DRAFT_437393 [Aspergillus steynii IBT 23096]|uniref:Uncharacterized protein n=1 Tax=Aspergillus steynii IBT 23096 TaxID=1392250 RepID=A0A2I2G3W4_9EURO|nr:uncharacterized protein P170DRAFT_437393 [Aspergillus steynii IBT 23096]PLB47561.1 hypothetical protein P170DRAFT_437393 [Aspergillus steynii IBT 23096]